VGGLLSNVTNISPVSPAQVVARLL